MDINCKEKNKSKGNKIKIITSIVLGIFMIMIGFVILINLNRQKILKSDENKILKKITIFLTFNKEQKMINDILEIVELVKNNDNVDYDCIYKLKDIELMGINIPISPYGTEYSTESYIKTFNGEYYACFDNGEQKVCGYDEKLEITKISVFNPKSQYKLSLDEAKILLNNHLKEKYNEEFVIDNLESITMGFIFLEYSGTAYPENQKEKKFKISIEQTEEDGYINIVDDYYNLLIQKN